MGYPIYKLLRAVNRQYPNNGFINFVDVREDIYDRTPDEFANEQDYVLHDKLIPEDLRDLINEAIQETYINIAIDEVWSFPTVPGQNQYALPEDCDLRDIQEVTRTFVGRRWPMPPPVGPNPQPGPNPQFDKTITFTIDPDKGNLLGTEGTQIMVGTLIYSVTEGGTLPEVPEVIMNEGYEFVGWTSDGETIISKETILSTPVTDSTTYTAVVAGGSMHTVTFSINAAAGNIDGSQEKFYYVPHGGMVSTVPTPTINEGYNFYGWTPDGAIIVDAETILSTVVTEDTTYMAVTEEEEDEMRSIITVSLSEDYTKDDSLPTKLPFDNVSSSVGTGLTLNANNYVVIGEGISKVLVSGQVCAKYANSGTNNVSISLITGQGAETSTSWVNNHAITIAEDEVDEKLISFSPVLIDVNEGDRLSINFAGASGDQVVGDTDLGGVIINKTHLTVEEVKTISAMQNYQSGNHMGAGYIPFINNGGNNDGGNNDGGYGDSPLA